MTEEARFAILAELTRIINPGSPVEPDYTISYRDYFEFSGLNTAAWCARIGISLSTHRKYLSGELDPEKRIPAVRDLSLAVGAVLTELISLDSFEYLKRYEEIKKICDVEL